MEITAVASRLPLPGTKPRSVQPENGLVFPAFTPTAGVLLSRAPAHRTALRFSLFPAF